MVDPSYRATSGLGLRATIIKGAVAAKHCNRTEPRGNRKYMVSPQI